MNLTVTVNSFGFMSSNDTGASIAFQEVRVNEQYVMYGNECNNLKSICNVLCIHFKLRVYAVQNMQKRSNFKICTNIHKHARYVLE